MTDFDLAEQIDSENADDTSADSLVRIRKMGELFRDAEKIVEQFEADLKKAKERRDAIRLNDLPELMTEVGITSFQLEDGSKIDVKDDLSCSITKAKTPQCINWLIDNGFGAIVKTIVSVEFGKDERDRAAELAEKISNEFDDNAIDLKETVHAATLKAFIKERMEAGEKIPPFDLFSVHPYKVAKLTPPKKRKVTHG